QIHHNVTLTLQFSYTILISHYGNNRDLHSFPTRRSSDLTKLQSTDLIFQKVLTFPCCHSQQDILLPTEPSDPKIRQEHARTFLLDRKSTRLNSSHVKISYAVFCLKKKKNKKARITEITKR